MITHENDAERQFTQLFFAALLAGAKEGDYAVIIRRAVIMRVEDHHAWAYGGRTAWTEWRTVLELYGATGEHLATKSGSMAGDWRAVGVCHLPFHGRSLCLGRGGVIGDERDDRVVAAIRVPSPSLWSAPNDAVRSEKISAYLNGPVAA